MASRGVSVKITYNILPEIIRRMPKAANEIVSETIDEIDAIVQAGMATSGGGRIYIRRGRMHQASAPGQMPAIDTGALAGSMQKELHPRQYKGYYYTMIDYAPYLEYGTSKMLPRPFISPSSERVRPIFMRKMRNLESRLR